MHVKNSLVAILLIGGACQGSLQVTLTGNTDSGSVDLSSGGSGNSENTETTTIEESISTSGTTTEKASTGSETSTGEPSDTTDGNSETTYQKPVECLFEAHHLPCDGASDDPFHALGLNCVTAGKDWVDGINATALSNVDLQAPEPMGDSRAWQVAKSYGNYVNPDTQLPFWSPKEGQTMLMMSNGQLPTPDDEQAVIIKDWDSHHDIAMGPPWDGGGWPVPITHLPASDEPFVDCDGIGDCSGSLSKLLGGPGDSKDKVWLHFEVVVPENAHGFHFDMAYFSAHWPKFEHSSYVDTVIVWQKSKEYTGNIAVNKDGDALSINSLEVAYQASCPKDEPDCKVTLEEFEGTSFKDDGGATNWFRIQGGGLTPGETLQITIVSMDFGDSIFNSTALIDGWKWECESCDIGQVGGCGIKTID